MGLLGVWDYLECGWDYLECGWDYLECGTTWSVGLLGVWDYQDNVVVSLQEVDIGLAPAAHIAQRSATLDFSDPILFSNVVMIYRKPEVKQNPMVIFSALSVRMIAAILGSLVIVTALMAALDMACEFGSDENSAVVAEVARATRVRKQLYRWLVTLDRTMRVTVAAILSEGMGQYNHLRGLDLHE